MVQDELRTGSLVSLMPDWQPLAGIIHAVFSSRRGQSPAVRSFVELDTVHDEGWLPTLSGLRVY